MRIEKMKILRMVGLLLVGVFIAAGCQGMASTTGTQAQCGSTNRDGSCTITINSLSGGAYSYEVKNTNFRRANAPVPVTVSVTVESGTVSVWLEDGNNRNAVQVGPGQTANTSGTAQIRGTGDERYFQVFFEAQGEGDAKRAEGIRAEISYEIP